MGVIMAIQYKFNIIRQLKSMGYTTARIRKEKIFSESTLQAFRSNQLVSFDTIFKLCDIFHCDIGNIIHYIPDQTSAPLSDLSALVASLPKRSQPLDHNQLDKPNISSSTLTDDTDATDITDDTADISSDSVGSVSAASPTSSASTLIPSDKPLTITPSDAVALRNFIASFEANRKPKA